MVRPANRTATIFLVAGITILLLWTLWSASSSKNTPTSANTPTEPVFTMKDLEIRLAREEEKAGTVRIEITNVGSDNTITFLTWDTPFDPRALDLGVIILSDAASGENLPGPGLKLNRKMPPRPEDFVEVLPGQSVRRSLEINGFWLPKEAIHVKVLAQGEWKAVWKSRMADISAAELEVLAGDRVLRSQFRSENTVEVSL